MKLSKRFWVETPSGAIAGEGCEFTTGVIALMWHRKNGIQPHSRFFQSLVNEDWLAYAEEWKLKVSWIDEVQE